MVTSVVIMAVILGLPLTFMRVHGFFDYENLGNHLFSLLAALRFVGGIGFLLLLYATLRAVESILSIKSQTNARAFRLLFVYGGGAGIVGHLCGQVLSGNIAAVSYSIASALLALLLLLRWYVDDALVSNYFTAIIGAAVLTLMLLFPIPVAKMYQLYSLVPQGLSGFWIEMDTERRGLKRACLVALGPKMIWYLADNKLQTTSRDNVVVVLPLPQDRLTAKCETITKQP